jgi:AP-3 complex subunit mu
VRHSIQFKDGSNGRFEVTLGPRPGLGKVVENASVQVEMPKSVLNMTLTASQGKYTFDPVKKTLNWEIGRIDPTRVPSLRGNVRNIYVALIIQIIFVKF